MGEIEIPLSEIIHQDQSEDWREGYAIGKKENLENVAFFFGIIIGVAIGMFLAWWI